MPWPSKRKQQLGNARDTKRQKQQPENPREDQQGRETQDDVLDGGDREPDPDCCVLPVVPQVVRCGGAAAVVRQRWRGRCGGAAGCCRWSST